MSVNRFKSHVLVLPEDNANSSLANGFIQELPANNINRLQVLPEAGGWLLVVKEFSSKYATRMRQFPKCFFILLLDLDDQLDRLDQVRSEIPADLQERVFVLSVRTEPEDLKKLGGGTLESWGARMAQDCDSTSGAWSHPLLVHNSSELKRLQEAGVPQLLLHA